MSNKIAVVGMACRFPGANNLDEYWNNLISGKDTIKHFSDDELADFEYNYDLLKNNPDFVKAKGILEDVDKFDASFFGMTPAEAAGTDPQHRIWLQTAWQALENAGCDPFGYKGAIGVFAGGTMSTYLLNNVLRGQKKMENFIRFRSADAYQILTNNDPSYISTKTAYKFNLKGPAINVQTACSTSLVAVSLACQSLYSYESDVCLAGGICVVVPQETGYIFQEGAIPSPDGVCRPFDIMAKGTVPSNGVGVVVLKRLEDAIRDGDVIYSIVRGWALNNDGNNKVSYTAPSIDGQAEVIMMAQAFAEVTPDDISYIEAHGTATQLGDPIEITGLTKAFARKTQRKQFCGLGSVKSNIGHTDTASGIASFIKASLAAYNKIIPPTLHYSSPNPHIDFKNSPFYVQDKLKKWDDEKPLIMGVSSFGIGGTNAHVIIEEPPKPRKSVASYSEWPELLLLSAKTEKSLADRKTDLIEFVRKNPEVNIRDMAFTLGTGRCHMKYRSFAMASSVEELISPDLKVASGKSEDAISKIAFMFPGQGAQYVSMGYGLYQTNNFFREITDECFSVYKAETGEDIKNILFQNPDNEEASRRLSDTEITQPALFIIEYATAKVLMQLGVKPSFLIGHSIGEYVAACIAGVFDMPTALRIVIMRGRMMQKMPRGEMMVAKTGKAKLEELKGDIFEIAADNANDFCTVSFKPHNSEKIKTLFNENSIQFLPLNTSHAFHSSDFDPILKDFTEYVNQFTLKAPQIPFVSCLTGTFITNEQATSGSYWASQLRNTVQFRKGTSTIVSADSVAFVETGPNTHLSSLVKQNESLKNKKVAIATLGKADTADERYKIISSIGNLFNLGIIPDFSLLQNQYNPVKISLPVYPFEKVRCWIDFSIKDLEQETIASAVADKKGNAISSQPSLTESEVILLTPAEKLRESVSNIWKSMFGYNEIGPDDNFLDIGGHSLLALQILARIKDETGQVVSLKEFLDNSTINKLCSLLDEHKCKGIARIDSGFKLDLSNLPLSMIQRRIWIISQLDPLNPAYNISFTYKFSGDFNVDVFEKSINLLFDRHFIIHSVFRQKNGEPYCAIVKRRVVVEQIDFPDLNEKGWLSKLHSFIGEESRKPFNIQTGPLYRLFLFKKDDVTKYFHASINHLVFDGWSWSVFIAELKEIYGALSENKEPGLQDVSGYYFEYFHSLNSERQLSYDEDSIKFWMDNLHGCPPKLNFPFDFERKNSPTGFGEKEMIIVPSEITGKLKDLSKRENATLFATVLSALGVIFNKYSGESSICIGTHVANRSKHDFENIFGMFVNTIPICLNIEENSLFTDFLNYTKQTLLNAISHQDVPFEKIVEAVNPIRSLNYNPLFQVSVVWISSSAIDLGLKELKVDRVFAREGISPFDITLYLWEKDHMIEGEIEYNVDILKRETISRFKENFLHLLRSIADAPEVSISELSILSDNERKYLNEFNRTDSLLESSLLQNLFESQVKLHPKNIAVISGTSELTYEELNSRSNQLAGHLLSIGAKEGAIVGIFIERSVEMVISVLGILKAGCCYLPLDPSFPAERLMYMIEDSGARIIVSQNSLHEKSKLFRVPAVVLVDGHRKEISSFSTDTPEIEAKPDSHAYIIYTSGSTGKPKGVPIRHGSVVNMINSMSKTPGITPDDKLLAVVTLSFDMSVYELFMSLSNGASLFVVESRDVANGQTIIDLIEKNNITLIQATPSFWHLLLSSGWKGKKDLKALCGGEALTSGLVKEMLPKVSEFWNCYGPTETTVYSTCTRITDLNQKIHIGRPLDNTRVYILDKGNKELPVGVIGEVAIAGKGLSVGYLNRPELTASKFINLTEGDSVYKTGDMGRFLEDGNIELLGRADNQIKLRGFRIEPGEIENQLTRIPEIREAVVKLCKFDENDLRLVAFIVTNPNINLSKETIVERLSKDLPPYMIPSLFQRFTELPRLPNRKVNKEALVFTGSDLSNDKINEIVTLSPVEKVIYDIWREALKLDKISPTDNFFTIGGNSLLAVTVFSRIEAAFNADLGLRVFFDSPKIKDIAEAIAVFNRKPEEKMLQKNANEASNKITSGEI